MVRALKHRVLLHRSQSARSDVMMRCAHRVAWHLDSTYSSGIRAACTSVGVEVTASLNMADVMGARRSFTDPYCLATTPSSIDASKTVCTSDRSCGCSQCSAGRSTSSHNLISNSARQPDKEMHLASGFVRHTLMSQRLQGLVAGIAHPPCRFYGSFSSSRKDHKTNARSYATLEDSQSKVSTHKDPASPWLLCYKQYILT